MAEYTVSEMAEILNLTKANVAWRLNRLGLKSPHDESHLAAVRDYLTNQTKPLTLWQMVKQRYGDDLVKYQNYSYRWRRLGKPDVTSIDEFDELWSKHVEERKEHAKACKEHSRHVGTSAPLVKKNQKFRHMYDWYQFDSNGTWDEEVKSWNSYYLDSGYKSCAARRLAYLEVLRQHHILDQDEYFKFKESKTRLEMAFH